MLYNKFSHLSLLLPSGQACVGVVETSLSASIVNSCLFTTRFLCTLRFFVLFFFLSHQNNELMITSPSFVYSSYFLLEAREVDFFCLFTNIDQLSETIRISNGFLQIECS